MQTNQTIENKREGGKKKTPHAKVEKVYYTQMTCFNLTNQD